MILVDTSVLVNLFRGLRTPGVALLRTVIQEELPFGIPDICAMEVLQGARDAREWGLLTEYLGSQIRLTPEDPWAVHVEAARIFFDCRRAGITVRGSIDCLVAAMTLALGGVLLHEDRDYERIARVRPLRFLTA